MKSPEGRVLLSADVRRQLRGDIDIAALERLLGRLPPQIRGMILEAAMSSPEGDPLAAMARDEGAEVTQKGRTSEREVRLPGQLSDLKFDDPELQSLLDAVLAPSRRTT